RTAEEARRHDGTAARVLPFALAVEPDDLFAVELVLVELVAAVVLDDAGLDAGGERGEAVGIVPRPAGERGGVGGGALQAGAAGDLAARLRPRLRVAQGAVEVGRRLRVGAAAGRDQVAGKFVERLAVDDAPPQPLVEDLHAVRVEDLLLAAQQIRPFEG